MVSMVTMTMMMVRWALMIEMVVVRLFEEEMNLVELGNHSGEKFWMDRGQVRSAQVKLTAKYLP